LKRKDNGVALRALRAALATNPPDRVTTHTDLAEAYLATGDATRAKQHTLEALEIAPTYERALDLLLRINESGR
jgi:Tfp pilus assembly protein PilF